MPCGAGAQTCNTENARKVIARAKRRGYVFENVPGAALREQSDGDGDGRTRDLLGVAETAYGYQSVGDAAVIAKNVQVFDVHPVGYRAEQIHAAIADLSEARRIGIERRGVACNRKIRAAHEYGFGAESNQIESI